jgi:hypothetical protein
MSLGLAKSIVATQVIDTFIDATDTISEDVNIRIVTSRDNKGAEVIRHSWTH